MIIHTLLQDVHPFKATHRLSTKPISYFVENNIFIHKKTFAGVELDEKGNPLEIFPSYYQKTMKKALIVKEIDQVKRPSPFEWKLTLTRLQYGMQKCRVSEYHDYPKHLIACPYCYKQDKHTHDEVRQFTLEHKRGFAINYLLTNRLLNFMILSLGLIGLIYLINTEPLNNIQDFLGLIRFTEKLEAIKRLIHADEIVSFLKNSLDWLLNLYRRIFGGAQS